MAMQQTSGIQGKLVREKVIVIERFSIELNSNAEEFLKDREQSFRDLFTQEGLAVNRFHLLKRDEFQVLERLLGVSDTEAYRHKHIPDTYHVAYPPESQSGWICCCSD